MDCIPDAHPVACPSVTPLMLALKPPLPSPNAPSCQALNRLGPSPPASSTSPHATDPAHPAAAPSTSFTDISINASEPHHRAHLSKRSTLDLIERRWGVTVVAKGRYYPPGVVPPPGSEPPLFLRIGASVELTKKVRVLRPDNEAKSFLFRAHTAGSPGTWTHPWTRPLCIAP